MSHFLIKSPCISYFSYFYYVSQEIKSLNNGGKVVKYKSTKNIGINYTFSKTLGLINVVTYNKIVFGLRDNI